jgi:hypothetical protein
VRPVFPSPASRLGRAQQARTSIAPSLFPLSVADVVGPRVRVFFFLPMPARFLSLIHHQPSPRLNLFLSFLGTAFGLYKSHAKLSRNHLILLKLLWSSRVRSPWAGALAATSSSRATTLVCPRLRSCPRWARHVLHSLPVLSIRWMVLGIELSRFPAIAPPQNAVGFLFWPERRCRLFPDPISVVRFKSSGRKSKIPVRLAKLLKSP